MLVLNAHKKSSNLLYRIIIKKNCLVEIEIEKKAHVLMFVSGMK